MKRRVLFCCWCCGKASAPEELFLTECCGTLETPSRPPLRIPAGVYLCLHQKEHFYRERLAPYPDRRQHA